MLSEGERRRVVERIREQVRLGDVRLTLHADDERVEDGLTAQELREVLGRCELVENYLDDRRGPSCLVLGYTDRGRPVHVVCTTSLPTLIVITVYEPRLPKWVSPTERRGTA